MAGEYTIRGTQKHQEQRPDKFIRDPRTIGERLNDGLKTPGGYAVMLFIMAASILLLSPLMEVLLLIVGMIWLIYRKAVKQTHLPARMPIEYGGIDYNDPLPTRKKYAKARGIFMMGNEVGTGKEVHFASNDMLTHMLLFGTTGSGKAQPLDAEILTPHGWRQMGELAPGEEVCTPDGKTASVLEIHPQGRIPIYEVRLEGGETTRACADHLWLARNGEREPSIVRTKQMFDYQRANWCLPVHDETDGMVFRRVVSLTYIGDDEAQCINIDHPDHLYITDDRIVTHNTESLLSLSWNSLSMGSGLIFIDPKGTNKLALQVWSMSRVVGRDDDFLIINYSTGNRTIAPDSPDRVSNTSNPFSHGTADFLSDIMNSLIPSSEGENAIFSERALSLMKTLMMGLVEMRDQGNLNLSVRTIREWMTIERCMEIMNNETLTETTRESMRAYLNSVAGFNPNKSAAEQGEDTLKQFGYAQAYFTRALSSLTDTYGHVYGSVMGEVDYRDVVFNRRILVALMPSMEKAPPELKALGKVVLAAIRSAMAMGLGNEFEGDHDEMIESLPSGSSVPNLVIADEYGYVATEGFAVAAAQARGLGFSCIFAGQDYAGFKRGDEKEAEQILANTKIKAIMALEDAAATWDVIKVLSGEVEVTRTEGFEVRQDDQIGQYRDSARAKTESKARVDLQDLRHQIEGEFHLFHKDNLIRGQMFHADPDITSSPMRINRMVEVDRPTQQELSAKYGAISYLKERFSSVLADLQSGDMAELKSPDANSSIVGRYGAKGDQLREEMVERMNRPELKDKIARREAAMVALLATFGSYTIDAPIVDDPSEPTDEEVDATMGGGDDLPAAIGKPSTGDKKPAAPLGDDEAFDSDDDDFEGSAVVSDSPGVEARKPAFPPDDETMDYDDDEGLEEVDDDEEFEEDEEDEAMEGAVPLTGQAKPSADAASNQQKTEDEPATPGDDDFSPALQSIRSRVNEIADIGRAAGAERRSFIDEIEDNLEDTAHYPVPPVPKGGMAKESRVLSSLERFRSRGQKFARNKEGEE